MKLYNATKVQFLFIFPLLLLFSCADEYYSKDNSSGSESGQGGSLARFTIAGDYLYTVDYAALKTFDISGKKPVFMSDSYVQNEIETIFSKNQTLFIGSRWGMFIYDISNPSSPQYITDIQHIYSCDPVVTDEKYAYITLHSEDWCGNNTNELLIYDITNINMPVMVSRYPMTRPLGLGIDNHVLFVCDDGLKVYNASNVQNLKLMNHFDIEAYDVIPTGEILLVIGPDGLYQYRYSNDNIKLLSHIEVQ